MGCVSTALGWRGWLSSRRGRARRRRWVVEKMAPIRQLDEGATRSGTRMLWRFFDRLRITRKESGARYQAGSPRSLEAT